MKKFYFKNVSQKTYKKRKPAGSPYSGQAKTQKIGCGNYHCHSHYLFKAAVMKEWGERS